MAEGLKDRFAGCIIGQCLGDALGFPVEGCPPYLCTQYVTHYLSESDGVSRLEEEIAFGQYTDDSQLARELLRSFVAQGAFDPDDYARRIERIFAEERVVGAGLATGAAAERLTDGVPWQDAAVPPPSAGNGTAMRAAPAGLFFHDRSEALIRAAALQGRITHADPRCAAGAVAIAGCVALALKGPVNRREWLTQLAEWVATQHDEFARYILELGDWLALAPSEAFKHISRCGVAPGYVDSWPGISPFVVGSVLWALYAFLRNPADYMATIRTAIAVGGDVDTTAAMAGAISGAHLGIDAIPARPARLLTDAGEWGYDELVGLAHRCCEITRGGALA